MEQKDPKNKRRINFGFYAVLLIIILALVYLLRNGSQTYPEIEYYQVREQFTSGNVERFVLEDDKLYLELRNKVENSSIVTHTLLNVSIFYNDLSEVIDQQLADGTLTYNLQKGWNPWWISILPYVLVMVVFCFLWFWMMNRAGGGIGGGAGGAMRFGKARTKVANESKNKVTFGDVAGADEEKLELAEVVDFLKGPEKYISLGARIPKGVLLVGPPGTGKTLLAKAVAGEAGVPFLSISGSDFVELYVGVGASRVRDLFDQAKKAAPAIVFIDEIDAVGRQRGSGLGGGHDEREQTLNQLLVEMDGFTNNEGVIVIAATNRADILDNALLRPGRFDRQIYVGMPDVKGREDILKVHARNKALAEDVDLAGIAKSTAGFTGADLENLLNEGALMAARRNARFITMADLESAILKIIAGPEKKSRVVTEKDRKLTAYHESGHAVVAHFLQHVDPVHQITIIPHGAAGGMTIFRPEQDKSFRARSEMMENIIVALGGRMAEKLFLDDISTGASGDIQQATSIARNMVTVYGMSDRLGPISFDSSEHSIFIGRDFGQTKSYSEETAAVIDEEVKHIFDEATRRCTDILLEHADLLRRTAEYLLEHETMSGEDFAYFCEHEGMALPEKPVQKAPVTPVTPEPEEEPEPEEPSFGDDPEQPEEEEPDEPEESEKDE